MTIYQSRLLRAIHRWDVSTFLRVNRRVSDQTWNQFARTVSHTADGWGYLLIPLVMCLWSFERGKIFFLVTATAFAIERSLYFVLKKGFKRRRPPQAIPGFKSSIIASDEFSFPSGHTSGAFLIVTMACIFLGSVMAFAYIWAAVIGYCRVVLGVHFPTDTFVGAVMGSSVALLTSTLVVPLF